MAFCKQEVPAHPYATHLLAFMRGQETTFGKRYLRQSPQLESRRYLVDWICLVAERTKLSRASLHLAVKLLDYFMDGHSIETKKLYLVSIACLTLAAKFEERDSKVPCLKQLTTFIPPESRLPYQKKDHLVLEVMVLSFFNWKIFIPTANTYVEILFPHSFTLQDKYRGAEITESELPIGREKFIEFVKYFLDLSIQDLTLVQKRSSKLAAAVLYSARSAYGISPPWSKTLENISGISTSEFADCVTVLMTAFNRAAGEASIIDGSLTSVIEFDPKPEKKRTRRRSAEENYPPIKKLRRQTVKGCRQSNRNLRSSEEEVALAQVTPDEGYISRNSIESCSSEKPTKRKCEVEKEKETVAKTSLDLLLEASNAIEATEQKHENFKEEILREMATVSNQSQFMVAKDTPEKVSSKCEKDTGVTNIQGTDVTQDDVFLYTVVKDEMSESRT